jgi:ABC-2 type transport system permease protein
MISATPTVIALFTVILDTARRETLHLLRDRRLALLLLVSPAALTVLFGYAFESNAITDIPVVVIDEDDSPAGTRLVEEWAKIRTPGADRPMLRIEHRRGAEAGDIEHARGTVAGHVRAAVHLPRGLLRSLMTGAGPDGRPARITLWVDGTDTITGVQVQAVLREAVDQAARYVARASPAVELHTPEPLFNPGQSFLAYMLPGVLGMTLMLLTQTPLAGQVAREREDGTLEQIAVSPAPGWALLAGKALPYLAAGAFDVACVAGVAGGWFGLRPESGWASPASAVLAAVTGAFLLAATATGLAVGAVARTRMQAVQAAVFYLMPALLLTGAYSPLESIPEPVRRLSAAFPVAAFVRAWRDAWFRGFSLADVAGDLSVMLGLAAVSFAAAVGLFRLRRE